VRLSSAAFPRIANFCNQALVCVVAAVVLIPRLSLGAEPATTNAFASDSVVAKGKGLEIKRSELDRAVARAEAQVASTGRTVKPEQRVQMERQLLEQLINNQLVLTKATTADKAAGKALAEQNWLEAKTRAGSAEAFERQQKLMGATREEVLAQWTKAMTGEAVLKREFKIKVSDQDDRKFYDENPAQFDVPETVRASHILLLTCDAKTGAPLPADQQAAKRQRIEELLKRARAGEDFAKLAREYSEDSVSRNQGGEYQFARGKFVPAVETVAFSLKTNEISDIVTSTYGYHIIKLSEKTPAHKVKYADAVTDIKRHLTQQAIADQFPDYVARLRQEAEVEILDEKLKPQEALGTGFSLPNLFPQPEKSPPAK
jgi:peptidyl-prolyl cis-trans isomerase C